MRADVLIVDDEPSIRGIVADILADEGYSCRGAGDTDIALRLLEEKRAQLVFLDIWLRGGDRDGLSMLRLLRERYPEIAVVMISGHGTIETAVRAIKLGAFDFLEKPFNAERLLVIARNALEAARLASENAELRARAAADWRMIGEAPAISRLRAEIGKVAPTESRVLISGPPGSGKELAARMIHARSRRSQGRFVVVNCATMAPERVEEELFGTRNGAGRARSPGMFERADGGTLLLDEVADMPARVQSRIVRVLQERVFVPADGAKEVGVDARVVATTSRDLETEMASGRFRQDLYFRLNVVPISIPPLGARREDIPALMAHFIGRAAEAGGMPPRRLDGDAIAALQAYAWPGNVRQLRNVAEWLLIMAPDPVTADALPPEILAETPDPMSPDRDGTVLGLPLRAARARFERAYLSAQLGRFDGNISRTAQFVGMERAALHRKLRSLGMGVGRSPESAQS